MTPARGRTKARRRAGRTPALLFALVRLMAFLAVFQASGLGHFVSDTIIEVATGHHPDDADEESDGSHQCPPGCPTCHHVHATGASLPAELGASELALSLPHQAAPESAYTVDAPTGPLLPSIYRPPRS